MKKIKNLWIILNKRGEFYNELNTLKKDHRFQFNVKLEIKDDFYTKEIDFQKYISNFVQNHVLH